MFFQNYFLYSVQLEPNIQWANNDNSVHDSPPPRRFPSLWPSPLRFPPTTGKHEYKLRSSSPGTAGPPNAAWFQTFAQQFACTRWLLNYWQINPDIWKTWTWVTTLLHLFTAWPHRPSVSCLSTEFFCKTKGCSFTGCLLAATQSKIMPCFCKFSLSAKICC